LLDVPLKLLLLLSQVIEFRRERISTVLAEDGSAAEDEQQGGGEEVAPDSHALIIAELNGLLYAATLVFAVLQV
jgi:hypothetical protein